jgi:hypothetical protein
MCPKTKYADAICKTCKRRLTKPDKVTECKGKSLGKSWYVKFVLFICCPFQVASGVEPAPETATLLPNDSRYPD